MLNITPSKAPEKKPSRPQLQQQQQQQQRQEEGGSVQAFFAAASAMPMDGPAAMLPPPPSFCKRLVGIMDSQQYGVPRYSSGPGQAGGVITTVSLPWGETFEGVEEPTKDAASESAARKAVETFETKGFNPKPPQFKQTTAFVPMQVSRKIVRTKSMSEERDVNTQPRSQDPQRVAEWVNNSNQAQPPPPPAAQRGRGRGNGGGRGGQGGHRGRGRGNPPGNGVGGGGRGQHQAGQDGPGAGVVPGVAGGEKRGKKKTRLAANFGGAAPN
jgi:hypothetical protein